MALYFVFFSDLFSDQRMLHQGLIVFRSSPLSNFGLGVSFDLFFISHLSSYNRVLLISNGTLFCVDINWLLYRGSCNDLLVFPFFRRIRICKYRHKKVYVFSLLIFTILILGLSIAVFFFLDFSSLLIWNRSSLFSVHWRGSALHIHGFNL